MSEKRLNFGPGFEKGQGKFGVLQVTGEREGSRNAWGLWSFEVQSASYLTGKTSFFENERAPQSGTSKLRLNSRPVRRTRER